MAFIQYSRYLMAATLILLFPTLILAELPSPSSSPLPTLQDTHNPDVRLTEKVQKKLTLNPLLKGEPISAASHKGIVTLQGSVKEKAQELSAIKSAESVKGVKKVKSQLTIRYHKKKTK